MSTNGPVSMEDMPGEVPVGLSGREVDPDADVKSVPNMEVIPQDEHMENILTFVPEPLRERVSKLKREELAMPGIPLDREAYEAYLSAEKMIRDRKRRADKNSFSWKGLPKMTG